MNEKNKWLPKNPKIFLLEFSVIFAVVAYCEIKNQLVSTVPISHLFLIQSFVVVFAFCVITDSLIAIIKESIKK